MAFAQISQTNQTQKENPFAPYCSEGLVFTSKEPITNVNIQEINNSSNAATAGALGIENFIDKVANLEQGKTYTISFQGNTAGTYSDVFLLYIDWNQNSSLTDSGELYFSTSDTKVMISNSSGTDGKTVSGTFTVPADAKLGNTRMRVKKHFGTIPLYLSPCFSSGKELNATSGTTGYGQVEDYTINVVTPSLGTSEISKSNLSIYPNPTSDFLSIVTEKKVSDVRIFSTDGKLVKTIVKDFSKIDVRNLNAGVYLVSVKADGSLKTFKIIKK